MPTITFKVTEFLRRRAVAAGSEEAGGEYPIVRDPVTGLPVMEAPPHLAPVSSERIRGLWTDFP